MLHTMLVIIKYRGGLHMLGESLKDIRTYLEECGQSLPSCMIESVEDLYVSLYIAKQLVHLGKKEEAFSILKEVYEKDLFKYDKGAYGLYEDYVEDKVEFLERLAALNLEVTQDLKMSIAYIDEALNLLDGEESVAPYIDIKKVKQTKKNYVKLLFNSL